MKRKLIKLILADLTKSLISYDQAIDMLLYLCDDQNLKNKQEYHGFKSTTSSLPYECSTYSF
jgi:hypothetical protein